MDATDQTDAMIADSAATIAVVSASARAVIGTLCRIDATGPLIPQARPDNLIQQIDPHRPIEWPQAREALRLAPALLDAHVGVMAASILAQPLRP